MYLGSSYNVLVNDLKKSSKDTIVENKNIYDLLESKVSLSSFKTSPKGAALDSGGANNLGICLCVPRLVTRIPIKIRMAATRP